MMLTVGSVAHLLAGNTAYLFSYFINDSKDGLHLAYSYDGLTWTPLNGGRSLLAPTVGKDKLMRDPSICQSPDGTFHMVWTSSWTDRIIGYASSRDLIHWSEQKAIPVMMHEPEAHNCWAPELFYDAPSQTFYIFWATTIPGRHKEVPTSESEKGLNHRIYYVTTKDFQTFSPTKMFFNPDFSVIDASIVKDTQRGDLIMVVKNENSNPPEKNLRVTRTTDITKGFPTEVSAPITGNYWAEGPAPLFVGDTLYVYFDKYRDHRYGAVRSLDHGATWEDVSGQVSFPKGTRHGTAFAVDASVVESLLAAPVSYGQTTHFDFDLTQPQPSYTDETGYGYDRNTTAVSKAQRKPMFFSVKVPEGDYKVTVTVGSRKYAGVTALRAETRRMVIERMATKKGELKEVVFNVNVRTPCIDGIQRVRLQDREKSDWGWDDKLTLEFNGEAPAVSRIRIEPNRPEMKIWLCGNSTVTDQYGEPYASWGQMLPYWFDASVSVENMAMSGLRTTSFIDQKRLEKIAQEVKKGDYVLVEFGHNDEKDRYPGSGAWYNFTYNLKRFIDILRPKGAQIILVTPTERRYFVDGKIKATHGDYPDAVRTVAEREQIPLIDLTESTTTLYNAMGDSLSKKMFVHYPANTYPGQEKDLKDNTHNNAFGAYETCKLIVMGMKFHRLGLVKHLRPEWTDFSPLRYDDWQEFYWPVTPTGNLEKPAGN